MRTIPTVTITVSSGSASSVGTQQKTKHSTNFNGTAAGSGSVWYKGYAKLDAEL